jgi:hydrogenase-4 component B
VTASLLVCALAVWAAGAIVDLAAGAVRWRPIRSIPYLAGMAGSALVAASGVRMVLGRASTLDLGTTLGVGRTLVRLDPLAGMFLTLAGGLGVGVSAAIVSWSARRGRLGGRGTGAGYLLLLGAVTVIFVAADAFTFLFAWESLTAAFYILVGIRRRDEAQARASWATLGIGKLSGAALLFGFLLLAGSAHSYAFSAWAHVSQGALHQAAFALIVVGFGAKAGLVPLQVWIPIGYPAAPGPIRAAMAGLAVNVGFYGLWRFLGILGHPPIWLAVAVLVVGGVTALLGIIFAAVQSGLNRVIAYSSVENAGVIVVGYGVALTGAATHQAGVMAIGLVAASLQVLAHAVAKTSLFVSCAFFESDFGTDDLDVLTAVGRRHRWSATTFALGSITLAGLPPTIGFVSEWFVLEALLQEFRLHILALRLGMAFAGALVALTAGVAALCFIRLLGIMILGRSPRRPADLNLDGGIVGRAGFALIAIPCLGLAAAAPWVLRFLALGLTPLVPHAHTVGALKEPWVLQPVFANFSILSPSWLFVVMPIGLALVAFVAFVFSRGRLVNVRRVPAWRSATAGVTGPDRYSAFGYANVLRHVLSNVLGSQSSTVAANESSTADLPVEHVAHRAHAEDTAHAHIEVRADVTEPVETYFYRRVRSVWLWMSRQAKLLQSGRLDAYIGYMLGAIVALLIVVAAMK